MRLVSLPIVLFFLAAQTLAAGPVTFNHDIAPVIFQNCSPCHRPGEAEPDQEVRLLAPFDPIVWDRRRFELLWSWPYRFEAYTPVAKRRWGYYALPLLWRESVIGRSKSLAGPLRSGNG